MRMNSYSIKAWESRLVFFLAIIGFFQPSLLCVGQELTQTAETKVILFSENIRPIFQKKCVRCHSSKTFFFGGLRLNSLKWIRKGGNSGPAIVTNHAEKSLLYQLIKSARMPPSGSEPLTPEEISRIEEWIQKGAK